MAGVRRHGNSLNVRAPSSRSFHIHHFHIGVMDLRVKKAALAVFNVPPRDGARCDSVRTHKQAVLVLYNNTAANP